MCQISGSLPCINLEEIGKVCLIPFYYPIPRIVAILGATLPKTKSSVFNDLFIKIESSKCPGQGNRIKAKAKIHFRPYRSSLVDDKRNQPEEINLVKLVSLTNGTVSKVVPQNAVEALSSLGSHALTKSPSQIDLYLLNLSK